MAQEKDLIPVKNKVKDFCLLLKRKGIPVEKVLLFGSHAKGTQQPWSDIDFCVISPQFGKNPSGEFRKLMRWAASVDSDLSPIPFHPSDLEDKYSTLVWEIKKTGQEIKL